MKHDLYFLAWPINCFSIELPQNALNTARNYVFLCLKYLLLTWHVIWGTLLQDNIRTSLTRMVKVTAERVQLKEIPTQTLFLRSYDRILNPRSIAKLPLSHLISNLAPVVALIAVYDTIGC